METHHQSEQLASQSRHPPQKRPRWLSIIIIIASILTLLFFIGATIFWIGLVHDKLSDTFGAIFTALGTIFGFIALVLAIPPFFQYLQERRTVPSPTSPPAYSNNKNDQSQFPTQRPAPNPGSKYSTKAQSHSIKAVEQSSTPQLPLPLDQPSQPMSRSAVQAPVTEPTPVNASKGDGNLKQLTVQQRSKLVEKLLACPTMRERSSRNRVVQELRFADTMLRNSEVTNKDDVMDIVNRCLNFSDGLQQLIDRIEYREENSLPMQELSAFLENLFSFPVFNTINVDLLEKLYELIDNTQVAKGDLYNLYCKSAPNGLLPSKYQSIDEGKILTLMIQDLAQVGLQSTQTGNKLIHPLLTFVNLLSRYVPASVRDELIQWREKTAAKEKITLEEEQLLAIPAEQLSEASFYLLVRFKPDSYDCTKPTNEPENFDVQAYFIREQNGKLEYLEGVFDDVIKAETFERDSLPGLLANLISRCELWFLQHRQFTNMFIIELFLPFTLLPCDNDDQADIHQWMIKDKTGNVTAISRKYPLVVRLYNRTYEGEPGIWLDWQRNWAMYKGFKGCIDEAKLRLLKVQQYHEEQEDLHVSLRDVLCLRMTFVPPRFDDTPQHIFSKMMSAGTSVALWPRAKDESLDEEAIEQTYHALLAGCNFPTLPKTLWQSRRQVLREKTSHLAHQLTLFWDDPDRLPLDAPCYPYVAPYERK